MATKFGIVLTTVVALAATSNTFASEFTTHNAGKDAAAPSVVQVRAQKLIGVDANNREWTLFEDERGVLLPLAELQQIGGHLAVAQSPVADGAYHDLRLVLANEVHVYGAPTGPVHSRLRTVDGQVTLNMLGTVLVVTGEVQPLALALDTGDSGQHQGAYALAAAADSHPARNGEHARNYGHEEEDD